MREVSSPTLKEFRIKEFKIKYDNINKLNLKNVYNVPFVTDKTTLQELKKKLEK